MYMFIHRLSTHTAPTQFIHKVPKLQNSYRSLFTRYQTLSNMSWAFNLEKISKHYYLPS